MSEKIISFFDVNEDGSLIEVRFIDRGRVYHVEFPASGPISAYVYDRGSEQVVQEREFHVAAHLPA